MTRYLATRFLILVIKALCIFLVTVLLLFIGVWSYAQIEFHNTKVTISIQNATDTEIRSVRVQLYEGIETISSLPNGEVSELVNSQFLFSTYRSVYLKFTSDAGLTECKISGIPLPFERSLFVIINSNRGAVLKTDRTKELYECSLTSRQ